MKSNSNIGEIGIDSIRIGGMRICDLPIAENAYARTQISLVADTERQNKIKGILSKYPKQRVAYLKSRIKECQENIDRIQLLKQGTSQSIAEYSTQLTLCQLRDKEIAKIPEDDPQYDEKIRELCKTFPVYRIDAMEEQIEQFKSSVQNADDVIAQEYKSISEFTSVLGLCEQRDLELRNLGVRISPTGA